MKRYWLLKSEPSTFSIDDLRRAKTSGWDGVRNYSARNFLKEMKPGDGVLFYHSSCEPPGIAGLAEVRKAAYPDPTQFDPQNSHFDPKAKKDNPTWFQIDVGYVRSFRELIPLEALRAMPELRGMSLFKRGRLSVHPVAEAEWNAVLKRSS